MPQQPQSSNDSPALSNVTSEEARYRRVQDFLEVTFDSINQGISIYDSQLRLVAWNSRYAELMGLEEDSPHLEYGAHLLDLYIHFAKLGWFGAGSPELLAATHVDAIRVGPLIREETLTPGSGRIVQISRARLPNGGIVATFDDITEREYMKAELQNTQRAEAIGHFAIGVAHNFRNVLTAARGYVELLSSQSEGRGREYCNEALNAIDHGDAMLDDLAMLTRDRTPESDTVDLRDEILRISKLLKILVGAEIVLGTHVADEPIMAQINPTSFETVLMNLIANSRDAFDGSKGRIEVRAEYRRDAALPIVITVADDGPGMTPSVLSQSTEPFFTTKPDARGMGMGLPTSKAAIEQMGGTLEVSSTPGEGTVVEICLPGG